MKPITVEDWSGGMTFKDAEALVTYLGLLPWDVPEGFTVDAHADALLRLDSAPITVTQRRFRVYAVKAGTFIQGAQLKQKCPHHNGEGICSVEIRGLEPLTPCMPCKCATSCAISPYSFVCRRGDSSSVPRCLNVAQIGGPYFSKFFYFFLPPILICRKPDTAHRLRCAASGGKGFKVNPGGGTSRPRAGSSNPLRE